MKKFLIVLFITIVSTVPVLAQGEEPVIESVGVTPEELEISVGDDYQLSAVVLDNTGAEVDTAVVWSVDADSNIGTISESGLFSAETVGTGFVIATLGDIADSAAVTVTEAVEPVIESVEVAPEELEIGVGDDYQFSAVVLDNTGAEVDTAVDWSVDADSNIGTISEDGLFSAETVGTGFVIATLGDIADSAAVTVTEAIEQVAESVEVFPSESTVSIGDSIQFQAEVKDVTGEDIDAEVTWSVSNPEVGTIDATIGLFVAEAEGETEIIAAIHGVSGTAEVTVVEEVILEPGVNTVDVQRQKSDGKITKFGSAVAEGGTVNIGGIPSPLNFMNGMKIYFPEGSLDEDITLLFKLPQFAKIKGKGKDKGVDFGDLGDDGDESNDIIAAVSFHVIVDTVEVSPYPFDPPLEVSLPYKRGLLNKLGIEPTDLGMYYVSVTGELVEEGITGITVDEELNKITGIVEHFSDIALAPKSAVVTAVEENDLPGGFSLSANYPNPFNPETTISYTLPEASKVQITIYNLLGQHVKTLVNEFKPVGDYSVQWDGTNDTGEKLTNGVYIYRMQAESFVESKKLMMIK